MKIIDFIIRGNQVKFLLGADNCNDYWGDDWNDKPYEHNAGEVYDRFVEAYFVKTFPWDYLVREPADGARDGNSWYSKEDMIKRHVPCVVALDGKYHDTWDDSFSAVVGNSKAIKYYFGDKIDEEKENIVYLKERKHDNLYVDIYFEANEDILRIISNTLGASLKYMANNKYIESFDKERYAEIEKITLSKYKSFIKKLIKNTYDLYKFEDVEKAISTLEVKLVKSHDMRYSDPKHYYVCCQSDNNFDIGEVKVK